MQEICYTNSTIPQTYCFTEFNAVILTSLLMMTFFFHSSRLTYWFLRALLYVKRFNDSNLNSYSNTNSSADRDEESQCDYIMELCFGNGKFSRGMIVIQGVLLPFQLASRTPSFFGTLILCFINTTASFLLSDNQDVPTVIFRHLWKFLVNLKGGMELILLESVSKPKQCFLNIHPEEKSNEDAYHFYRRILLLFKGCTPDLCFLEGINEGNSKNLLHLACQFENIQVIHAILDTSESDIIEKLMRMKDSEGNTPLQVACSSKFMDLKTLSKLFESASNDAYSDINCEGMTVLHCASKTHLSPEAMDLLLKAMAKSGCDRQQIITKQDHNGYSVFHYIISEQDDEENFYRNWSIIREVFSTDIEVDMYLYHKSMKTLTENSFSPFYLYVRDWQSWKWNLKNRNILFKGLTRHNIATILDQEISSNLTPLYIFVRNLQNSEAFEKITGYYLSSLFCTFKMREFSLEDRNSAAKKLKLFLDKESMTVSELKDWDEFHKKHVNHYLIPASSSWSKRMNASSNHALVFFSTTERDGALDEGYHMTNSLYKMGITTYQIIWEKLTELLPDITEYLRDIGPSSSLLILCMMAHGFKGTIVDKDDKRQEINGIVDLVSEFIPEHIPVVLDVQTGGVEKDIHFRRPHTILLCATVPDGYAVRGAYTKALAHEFSESDGFTEILSMHYAAAAKIKEEGPSGHKQISYMTTTCDRHLFLPAAVYPGKSKAEWSDQVNNEHGK